MDDFMVGIIAHIIRTRETNTSSFSLVNKAQKPIFSWDIKKGYLLRES